MILEEWAKEALSGLPDTEDDDPVELSRRSLPVPANASTDEMVLRRSAHWYDTFPVEALWWYGGKVPFGSFGLLLFATILHDDVAELRLDLTNPASDVKTIRIEREALIRETSHPQLVVHPESFEYWAADPARHPWHVPDPPSPDSLPHFRLTNRRDMVVSDADLAARDTLNGFGTLGGTLRFAELLLDLSRPSSATNEINLECEAGYRGVAPASAEVRLWLPGSEEWPSEWFVSGVP